MNKIHTQAEWIARAKDVLPAGGFGNFDHSIIIARGEGCHVWDEDGNDYIDYLIGSGPMLLGHGHPEVLEAVLQQVPTASTLDLRIPYCASLFNCLVWVFDIG